MIAKINSFFRERNWLVTAGVIVLTIITLALTLMPAGKVLPHQVWTFDKVGHLLIFGSWTFLLGYYRFLRKSARLNLFTIFIIGVLFGAAVEILQYLMPFHRHPDWFDIAFDALGCFLAIFALHIVQKRSHKGSILRK